MMYLVATYFFLILKVLKPTCASCGCQLDRNAACGTTNNLESKYKRELNEIRNDNNNVELNQGAILRNAFARDNMVFIEANTFEMGTHEPVFVADFEGPVRNVTVDPYYLDKYEVSNGDFSKFIEETGYVTEADKFGDSFVFKMLLNEEKQNEFENYRAVQAPWWYKVQGVTWRTPEGPGSNITGNDLVYITISYETL